MNIYFVGNPEVVKGIDGFYKLSLDLPKNKYYWFCWTCEEEIKQKYPTIIFETGLQGVSLKNRIKEMNLMVCMSKYESFCLPIAEALLLEKPVISYNIPELVEIYKDKVYFINIGDYDKILAVVKKLNKKNIKYKFNLTDARNYIISNFSPLVISKKILKILNDGQ